MHAVISVLRFLHDDSIASNLVASAIAFAVGAFVGSTFLKRHIAALHEIHRLVHHVHQDAAKELGHEQS